MAKLATAAILAIDPNAPSMTVGFAQKRVFLPESFPFAGQVLQPILREIQPVLPSVAAEVPQPVQQQAE
ncbi:MAG: hypothetical protein R3C26_23920 [Calditrichia bacterium]